ncbi:MAG: threonine-phosphate decarboxylase [Rhodobiaceae bacterium]|nr:threonine-phosphate decarboxylase [Rhodobiaceae bacterium]
MSMLLHGGDLEAFGRKNPEALRPLIDLSTGINPRAYGASIEQDWLTRLPSDADEQSCRTAFASYAGIDRAFVHVMPGTQTIISGLPHLFPDNHVVVLSPTYGEHEASWRAAGHVVSTSPASEILRVDADIIVVTNPNNPDGYVFEKAALRACQARQKARGGYLVVDEAFVDSTPQLSVAQDVHEGGLLVLRSFGKFFGLAGLRLGFLLGPEQIAEPLTQRLGPWSTSTPALHIAATAYEDTAWIAETRSHLNQEMDRLLASLVPRIGTEVGRTSLFALLKVEDGARVAGHLAAHGIFVRTFPNMPNYLRLGLPGEPWAWDRLETALTEWEHKNEC